MDTGTHESLLDFDHYARSIQSRQGLQVAWIEETAIKKKWITEDDVIVLAAPMRTNRYVQYHLKNTAHNSTHSS